MGWFERGRREQAFLDEARLITAECSDAGRINDVLCNHDELIRRSRRPDIWAEAARLHYLLHEVLFDNGLCEAASQEAKNALRLICRVPGKEDEAVRYADGVWAAALYDDGQRSSEERDVDMARAGHLCARCILKACKRRGVELSVRRELSATAADFAQRAAMLYEKRRYRYDFASCKALEGESRERLARLGEPSAWEDARAAYHAASWNFRSEGNLGRAFENELKGKWAEVRAHLVRRRYGALLRDGLTYILVWLFTKPWILLGISALVVGVFAERYYHKRALVCPLDGTVTSLADCIYFSVVTFTTLGYGDIRLVETWRLWGSLEAIAGAFLMATFVASTFRRLEVAMG